MADEPEARENWLPYFMDKAGVSQSALARLAETDRQQILKLRKRVQAVPKGWAERIAPHLDTTAVELTYGPGVTAPPEELDKAVPVTLAPVAGTTAAGMWLAEDYIDATLYEPVPVAMNRYPDLEHVAYKVSGPSMEGVRIFDGDYVIVVPYWQARSAFQDNDIVVVERRERGRLERTCKQIVVAKDHVQLWPRSSLPSYREPLVVPLLRKEVADDSEIEVVGLVVTRQASL